MDEGGDSMGNARICVFQAVYHFIWVVYFCRKVFFGLVGVKVCGGIYGGCWLVWFWGVYCLCLFCLWLVFLWWFVCLSVVLLECCLLSFCS
jgi:hypothetical protein